MARIVCAPAVAFQVHWNGALALLPIWAPSTKKRTCVTGVSGAVAISTTTVLSLIVLLLVGARILKSTDGPTGGGAAPTVIRIAGVLVLLEAGLIAVARMAW